MITSVFMRQAPIAYQWWRTQSFERAAWYSLGRMTSAVDDGCKFVPPPAATT